MTWEHPPASELPGPVTHTPADSRVVLLFMTHYLKKKTEVYFVTSLL